MRLFGLEITRVPKKQPHIWSRAGRAPIGLLITEMTPDELREELTWVVERLGKGDTLFIGAQDPFRWVQALSKFNNVTKHKRRDTKWL